MTATEDTALVWRVEPADSWPAGDLLGDEPAKLVPTFDTADLTETERDIRESLRETGGIGDGILCFGGFARFSPGERVDVFDVHDALVVDLREDDGPFGKIARSALRRGPTMSNGYSDPIQQVREAAREQAKDIDKYAICCSDGDFEYARTRDVATDIRAEMRAMRESLQPSESHGYDVITLGANEGGGRFHGGKP